MKKDFRFGWAFTAAILMHILLGFVLKRHPLLIASTAPVAPPPPLQMQFVESPPEAKTVPSNPNARYLSDANRKAGPLVKSEKREPVSTQYGSRVPAARKPSSAPASPMPGNQGSRSAQSESGTLPPIEQAPVEQSAGPGDYAVPRSGADGQKLSKSLQNLDQFIGEPGSGGGSQQGDFPTGDTGSGVFFDTQGFDLGPWANRVVAIVRSNWIIPVAAELGVKGIVAVSFEVQRTGHIVNAKVMSSSGTPSFDQAALNALKTSSPVPPLPADFPRPVLPGIFRFYYNIAVPRQ